MTYSPGGGSSGAGRISTASDAAMSGLANNQFLMYNASSGKWVNHTLAPADFAGIDAYIDARIQAGGGGGGGTSTKPGAPTNVAATAPSQTSITLTWAAPSSNGGSAITGYVASVSGGASQNLGASTLTATFTGLTAGTAYTLSVAAKNANGTGTAATTSITLGGGGGGGGGGGSTNPLLAALSMPARGWFSGAAGPGSDGNDTAFGNWRGNVVDFNSTWIDGPDGANWGGDAGYGSIGNLIGICDIAIGGPSGGNMGSAATGSMDSAFTSLMNKIKAYRTVNGVVQPTVIRPFHEFNSGYSWVASSDTKAQQIGATCSRWKNIMTNVFPQAMMCLGGNGQTANQGVTGCVNTVWNSSNGCFDIVATDRYNHYPFISNQSDWDSNLNKYTKGDPDGIGAWLTFAGQKGVPVYLPEYGSDLSQGSDNPYWTTKMLSYIQQNAGKGPGKVLGECWFNIDYTGDKSYVIYPNPTQTSVANAYKSFFSAL